MADYDEMLTKAIKALPTNTGAGRRGVYEKAREALISQLRKINPPLPARDITAHRLQLEDVIRRVEQRESEAVIAGLTAPTTSGAMGEIERLIAEANTQQNIHPPSRSPSTIISRATPEAADSQPPNTLRSQGVWSFSASPLVFKKPRTELQRDYASVMMPFSEELTPVFRTIQGAAKDAGYALGRGDDIWEDQVIVEDIFSMIFRSQVVICDFTGRNPNVFYEAGIAHTLGRHVIPIVQDRNDIPFDIRHHRYLVYRNTRAGRANLRRKVAERMQTISAQKTD